MRLKIEYPVHYGTCVGRENIIAFRTSANANCKYRCGITIFRCAKIFREKTESLQLKAEVKYFFVKGKIWELRYLN